jgi:hypothetical protein
MAPSTSMAHVQEKCAMRQSNKRETLTKASAAKGTSSLMKSIWLQRYALKDLLSIVDILK